MGEELRAEGGPGYKGIKGNKGIRGSGVQAFRGIRPAFVGRKPQVSK